MAKQIEGVYEKVLECAKAEFLEKGFQEASLRTIARNAGTSTGSIYTRFSDKNGLFSAIVSPVEEELKAWFLAEQESFDRLPSNQKKEKALKSSAHRINAFTDRIYRHFDIFKLLLTCSEGTPYADFLHELVEMDVAYTVRFIESIGSDALSSGRLTDKLLHILSSAFFSGIFEIVVHDMTREEADIYITQLWRFFLSGWESILTRNNEVLLKP
ncbi:TetR/AcrR family transcriptional regulator [Desulforamulus ruminis]|uniref:Regulatory protein TetR n=1 Tax=Desulforamulus ruminis (strain ATCC 23193 / DSM 2154 / NCIMB 8452 / DL) TaxID=696281 RepID=F6DSD0_DESRL|nr:TetR/AcrR family transcriptional regulator [Desulforamulus ruminis]AEG59909.1 regulatory protein TetR [Desulforamulus ruminis DSM 2154]